ncbi:MAG: cytochrome C [Cyclobacteriaceae bacterium]
MNKKYNIAWLFALLILPAFIVFSIPFLSIDDLPPILSFIGRFHPVILHFPIVLISLVLIMELLVRFQVFTNVINAISFILSLAALSGLIVAIAGYLLYVSEAYEGNLAINHFWGGVLSCVGILLTTFFYFVSLQHKRNYRQFYFTFLLLTNGTIAYTSHLGGSLTHGRDYLTEYLPQIVGNNDLELKPVEEMMVYEDLIVPFFETKCMSCHNEHKTKGGLLMTSYESLLKGGSGEPPTITEGDADHSGLFQRVILPAEHKDRMPPEGKKGLTEREIALLKFWINDGAKKELAIKEASKKSEVNDLIQRYLPESIKLSQKLISKEQHRQKTKQVLMELSKELRVSIKEDPTQKDSFVLSTTFPPHPFTGNQLAELGSYFSSFSMASLVSSDITDDDLYFVGKMTNLKTLYLQKTGLTGSGFVHISKLPNLEVLNLSFTNIEDAFLLELIKFPTLKTIYLLETKVSPEVIEAVRKNRPGLQIRLEEGPYY